MSVSVSWHILIQTRVDITFYRMLLQITTMSESCQEMTTELSTARKQMQGLLEKTSKIKRERSVYIIKEMDFSCLMGYIL